MSTRFLYKVRQLGDIINLPTSAGIGVFGGLPYFNSGGGTVQLALSGVSGTTLVVDPDNDGAYATVQDAVDAAASGDKIMLAPGSYDEALVIATSGLTFIGSGNRGSIAIAPSATDAVAVTVDGTTGTRVSGVTFINIGMEGNGTGGGLLVMGDTRRIRAFGCKIEGGAFGVKLESTADGSVADTSFVDNEICWTDVAFHIAASGGGDPVTQTMISGNFFHNYIDDGVLVDTVHTADLWVVNNTFANQEDATEPTQYIDAAVASTTGFITGNTFATTVLAATKFALAAGVIWAGNQVQAEGPATGGGTAGRPD